MSDMVTKVIMIDNDGNIYGSVQNDADLKQFGLFQEVYNYNTDIKNNQEEARKPTDAKHHTTQDDFGHSAHHHHNQHKTTLFYYS